MGFPITPQNRCQLGAGECPHYFSGTMRVPPKLRFRRSIRGEIQTTCIIQVTPQKWRSLNEVNRTLWQRWIAIYRPSQVTSTTGMLCITGGPNDVYHPGVDPSYASIATTSHTVVSVLYDVPNQTLTFTNDAHGPRGEDGIIAYTWKRYLETGDATWLARLPMTKAAVRYSFAKSCRQLKCATKTALAMALSSRIYLNPAWIQAQFFRFGRKRGFATESFAAVGHSRGAADARTSQEPGAKSGATFVDRGSSAARSGIGRYR